MTTFLYELPTTGAISFADFCVDRSLGNSYTTHIANATQSRANLRGVLKENKRTDGEKDYLKIVKVIQCCHTVGPNSTHIRTDSRRLHTSTLLNNKLCSTR